MKLLKIIPLFVATWLLVGCEEVIDISVPDSEQVPVIDATFNATDETIEVAISKTRNYLGDDSPATVTDAIVNIITPEGETIKVDHTENGVYSAICPQSYAGEYELQVEIDDEVYSANAAISREIPIKEYRRSETEFAPPEEVGIIMGLFIDDPADEKNYYRLRQWKNDTSLSEILITDDAVFNGQEDVEFQAFVFGMKTGDSMYAELRSISADAFRYLEAVDAVAGASTDSAAPGNPESNWNNGALGFFTAYTYSSETFIKD